MFSSGGPSVRFLTRYDGEVSEPLVGRRYKRPRFDPWGGKVPWRRERLPTPVFLPGASQRQRSLEGYIPWDPKESDTT